MTNVSCKLLQCSVHGAQAVPSWLGAPSTRICVLGGAPEVGERDVTRIDIARNACPPWSAARAQQALLEGNAQEVWTEAPDHLALADISRNASYVPKLHDLLPTLKVGVAKQYVACEAVSYTHLRAHETEADL
eukprot:4044580-Amphidinium_carterae.1